MGRAGFSGPDAQGRWNLHGESAVVRFFARDYPRWQKEWDVSLAERLKHSTTKNFERLEPRFEIRPSGERWFDGGMSLAPADGEKFSAADIQRLILSGNGTTRLKNGRIALIDTGALEEFTEVLRDCAPQQHARAIASATCRRDSSTPRCASNPAGRCRPRPAGANARRNKVARPSSRVRHSARSKTCCAPTNGTAWPGCNFCVRTSSGASWRTRWAWAKRSRRWRSSSRTTRTASYPAPCSSSARLRWSSTGWPRRRNSRPD